MSPSRNSDRRESANPDNEANALLSMRSNMTGRLEEIKNLIAAALEPGKILTWGTDEDPNSLGVTTFDDCAPREFNGLTSMQSFRSICADIKDLGLIDPKSIQALRKMAPDEPERWQVMLEALHTLNLTITHRMGAVESARELGEFDESFLAQAKSSILTFDKPTKELFDSINETLVARSVADSILSREFIQRWVTKDDLEKIKRLPSHERCSAARRLKESVETLAKFKELVRRGTLDGLKKSVESAITVYGLARIDDQRNWNQIIHQTKAVRKLLSQVSTPEALTPPHPIGRIETLAGHARMLCEFLERNRPQKK